MTSLYSKVEAAFNKVSLAALEHVFDQDEELEIGDLTYVISASKIYEDDDDLDSEPVEGLISYSLRVIMNEIGRAEFIFTQISNQYLTDDQICYIFYLAIVNTSRPELISNRARIEQLEEENKDLKRQVAILGKCVSKLRKIRKD